METLEQIISAARQQEKWSMSHKWNYGPIDYLHEHLVYRNDDTIANYNKFERVVHMVTDYETFFVWEHKKFDLYVDGDHMVCIMHRTFPDVSFQEVCRLLRKHRAADQVCSGISLPLVPDVLLIKSDDAATRNKFLRRHEEFYRLSCHWLKGDELNIHREDDLRRNYDKESLVLHFMLSEELYYLWSEDRADRCLEEVQRVRPEVTADDLRRVFEDTKHGVSELYG